MASLAEHVLTVTVRDHLKVLVPRGVVLHDVPWQTNHSCYDLLVSALERSRAAEVVAKLEHSEIEMLCVEDVSFVPSSGFKRPRSCEEIVCTALLKFALRDVIVRMHSTEFVFVVKFPHEEPRPRVDATARLMAAARPSNLSLPAKRHFKRMQGHDDLNNALIDYLALHELGWSSHDMQSGQEFLTHVSTAFFCLTPKVWEQVRRFPRTRYA